MILKNASVHQVMGGETELLKEKKSEAAEKEVALVVVHVKDLAKLGRRKGPSSSPGLKVLPGNWVVMPHLEKEAFFRKGLTFFACRIQRDFPRLIKAPLTDSEAVTKSAKAFHLDCIDSKKGERKALYL